MKIKRLINCFIPSSVCNLSCGYCYVPQCENRQRNTLPQFKYDAGYIRKALSKERLDGVCIMNVCADGETLLPKETPDIILNLVEEGHYIEVVTNGTLSDRFNNIFQADRKLLSRLEFKFSFHYAELKRRNMLDVFWDNVHRARKAGCSFTVELTPHDELIREIPQIRKMCKEQVGADSHVTIAYNYQKNFALLTKLSEEEYRNTWGQFGSPMFEFKMSMLGQKRNEYCYAGDWLISVDITTGKAHQCYFGLSQNIFENLNKPIRFLPIGHHCKYPLCFNAHAMLTLGAIPELNTITYADIRNRVCANGSEWLGSEVKEAFSSKFIEANTIYTKWQKRIKRIRSIGWKISNIVTHKWQ